VIGARPLPYPFIPNADPAIKQAMLEVIGVASVDDLFAAVPEPLRFTGTLDLEPALPSEHELRRHVDELLEADVDCRSALSFLGGGCWQHAVPAVCDEIAGRAEFLTAYWGNAYTDHGKYQAFFEFASLLGELLELDAVALPTYDWGMAAGVSIRMACRLSGRRRVVLAGALGPERTRTIRTYCAPDLDLVHLPFDPQTGEIPLERLDLRGAGCLYFEQPGYLGVLETRAAELCAAARSAGATVVVGVDPSSLGVLEPPAEYGADIVCGELQPLGIRMHLGGGLSGFIATADEERLVREYPTFLIGLTPTDVPGEHGFGLVAWDRTSYVKRERGKDFAGTTTGLWAIIAGVYLAALGPEGMRELGEAVVQRSHYAALRLGELPGVRAPHLPAPYFKELVVNVDGAGLSAAEVNARLLERRVFGGVDLSGSFPELGQSLLVSVTEIHSKADIDRLAAAMGEIVA
jgi:glycine dehydrogenase subunit 1